MLKIAPLLLCLPFLLLGATGCEKKKTRAQEIAEKAKLEKEKRRVLAAKYYQDIVDKYPDSEFAAKAKERLLIMGPATAPGGKPTPKKK